jgi:hypothetical protein
MFNERFICVMALDMFITLDVSPGLALAPFSRRARNPAVTKKGAIVLVNSTDFHPSMSSSNRAAP